MADTTGISWTDATWNPVRGCSRVSEGCVNCYAEVQAARTNRQAAALLRVGPYEGLVKLVGPNRQPRWTGVVRMVPEHLADPLKWKRPRRIFVNSMSDMFHESLADEDIAVVFGVMALAAQHTYQVLTKRARRMREFFERWTVEGCIEEMARSQYGHLIPGGKPWNRPPREESYGVESFPLPWVWLGVSVENQEAADERIRHLMNTPAAVRFLSCEPLLGPVTLADGDEGYLGGNVGIDWIIAGCESGPGARPCSVEWLRSLRDQCAAAGVAFFLKQAVETDMGTCGDADNPNGDEPCGDRIRYYVHGPKDSSVSCGCCVEGAEDVNGCTPLGFGDGSKRKPGGVIELPYLDGVQHAAFPPSPRNDQ